jgi:hypothetical protein
LYGAGTQTFIDCEGNNHQHIEMTDLVLTKGGSAPTVKARVAPSASGNADKTLVLRGRSSLTIVPDLTAITPVVNHRTRVVLDIASQSGSTPIRNDVVYRRLEQSPQVDSVHDIAANLVRLGERLANGRGSTEIVTMLVSHTFSGTGNGSGGYTVVGAVPAGTLVLGVTVRRDLATPMSPGNSALDVGTASDPDKWGSQVLNAGGGGGDNQRTDSDDFTDGSPLWFSASGDLAIQKREGGVLQGTLNGVRVHFTIHGLRCVGGPE